MFMSHGKLIFRLYLHELRTRMNFSQKKVIDKISIDISLLNKIEHGERQIQSKMLKTFAKFFKLDYKKIQIQFLNQKIEKVNGNENEPYLIESLKSIIK